MHGATKIKLKLLCMLNYSHSHGMSKAYVTGSQVRESNIWTYEVLSSNTEIEILWVKLKVKTVHPLNLLHSRLWLCIVISATLTIFQVFPLFWQDKQSLYRILYSHMNFQKYLSVYNTF
jgi:hypothetical protein